MTKERVLNPKGTSMKRGSRMRVRLMRGASRKEAGSNQPILRSRSPRKQLCRSRFRSV